MERSRHKGSALLIVILIMAVMVILGTSLLSLSLADTKNSVSQDKKTQAHYIGRSGVYVGFNLLKNKLTSKTYTDLDTLVTDLNTAVSALSTSDKTISDKGSFSLSYERFNSDEIKISSTGTTAGSGAYSNLVTFIVKIKSAIPMQENPDVWINGINLRKGIDTSKHYLGCAIAFSGKPIQSPQNADADSTYQASILFFTDYKTLSLQQKPQSKSINFDSEIIYFVSGVELNKTSDPVYLKISADVLNYRAAHTDGVIPQYSPAVGFENYDRYKSFIGTYTNDLYTTYQSEFMPGYSYGLAYFGGDVYEDKGFSKITKGYYYYRNGVNLHDPTAGETGSYKNLIQIPSDDAVIKALDNLFRPTSSSSGYIWNRK